MPVRVGARDNWQIIQATTEWQTMQTYLTRDQFKVATDLYYVDVEESEDGPLTRVFARPRLAESIPPCPGA